MDALNSFIQSITSGDSDLLVIVVIFGAVIVTVFGVAFLFMKAPAQRRREQRSGTAAAAVHLRNAPNQELPQMEPGGTRLEMAATTVS